MDNFELEPINEKSAKEPTVLDQLRTVVSKKVERAAILIEVPERPNVTIKVRPHITQHQIKAWRKNAGEETKAGLDSVKFACSVVGHTTVGVFFNNEEVFDKAGNSLNFASADMLEMTGTDRPLPDCVREFFGIEPHVEAAALAIMEHAGFGDTVDAVDPMKTS